MAALAALLALLRPGRAQEACAVEVPHGAFESNLVWTATSDTQPYHVTAPFLAELSPPMAVEGLCDAWHFSPSLFLPGGLVAGEWIAFPLALGSSVALKRDGDPCSQPLDGLTVSIAEAPALRLHFAGCDRPASVMAVRIVNDTNATDIPPVEGISLLDFMCQVSGVACRSTRPTPPRSLVTNPELDDGPPAVREVEVGPGRCKGDGVVPEELPDVKSQSTCADECKSRVAESLQDLSKLSCRGYAWSETEQSCLLYNGWFITDTSAHSDEDYNCYIVLVPLLHKPGPKAAKVKTDPILRRVQQGNAGLLLASLFSDPAVVSARRVQVAPYQDDCFKHFDWLTLDTSIYLPADDYALLLAMAKHNVSDDPLSTPAATPRTELVVERVCMRDCTGSLRGDCKQPLPSETSVPAAGGREVSAAKASVPPCSSPLCKLMGREALESIHDPDFWPWALVLGLLAGLAGFIASSCLTALLDKKAPARYQMVDSVKLIYEGDEEDEVVLQSSGVGSLLSITGTPNALASFQPSKGASQTASNLGSRRGLVRGSMSQQRNPRATW